MAENHECCYVNICMWMFPKIVVPNNHGVFLLKLIILGCFGGTTHICMSCHFHRTTQRPSPSSRPGLELAVVMQWTWTASKRVHASSWTLWTLRRFCCKDFFFTPKFNIFAPGPKNGLKLHLPSQKMKIKHPYRKASYTSSIAKYLGW